MFPLRKYRQSIVESKVSLCSVKDKHKGRRTFIKNELLLFDSYMKALHDDLEISMNRDIYSGSVEKCIPN